MTRGRVESRFGGYIVVVFCTPTMTRFPGFTTNGVYGTSNAIVLVLWEIRRPRNYVLTATFEF